MFGISVTISEESIAVGAYGDDNENGIDAGAVYLFTIDGEFVEKLIAPNGNNFDYIDLAVSISGNTMYWWWIYLCCEYM